MFKDCDMKYCKFAYVPAITICNLRVAGCKTGITKNPNLDVQTVIVEPLYSFDDTPIMTSLGEHLRALTRIK